MNKKTQLAFGGEFFEFTSLFSASLSLSLRASSRDSDSHGAHPHLPHPLFNHSIGIRRHVLIILMVNVVGLEMMLGLVLVTIGSVSIIMLRN